MSTVITSQSSTPNGIGLSVAVALGTWFTLVAVLGAAGAFASPPGTPPLPIFVGVVAPIIAFFLFFWLSPAFRDFALNLDLRVVTAIQAWRAAGFGFIALYVHHVLPGSFAWPAGLGDLAIGLTAPWVILALIRRPNFAASNWFVAWNVLGLLDLVDAVSTGALSAALATGAPGEITSGPMAELPLVLIPAYLVPIFVMLHAAALFQSRRLTRH
jgi:hypothetical protein